VAKAGAPIYEVLLWILRETPRPQAAYAWTQLVDVLADHNLPWDPEIMRQRALEVVQRDARRLLSSARSAVAAATFAAIEPCAARSQAPVHGAMSHISRSFGREARIHRRLVWHARSGSSSLACVKPKKFVYGYM